MQQAPVYSQTAQHDAVHEHPSDQGRGGALVEREHALIADRLENALQGTTEAGCGGGLQTDLNGVEGMADWYGRLVKKMSQDRTGGANWEKRKKKKTLRTRELCDAGKDTRNESLVVLLLWWW